MTAQTLTPTLVIGAGAWGTALAMSMARNGHPIWLWGRDAAARADMYAQRQNARYLPDITFPDAITIVDDLAQAIADCRHIMICVPSKAFYDTLMMIKPLLKQPVPISWATKGFTPEQGEFLDVAVQSVFGQSQKMAVVSGPSFAAEVAKSLPTAITVASNDAEFAQGLAGLLHSNTMRAYTSHDMLGVEIGGTLKNVLAIATGISDGLGYGANARAALITRGMAEIRRFAAALGAESETLFGLAGIGDLILTCTDNQSRNRQLGLALGEGLTTEEAVKKVGKTVEGMSAAPIVLQRAQAMNVDMPIVEQVCKILFSGYDPRESVQALLCREQKAEIKAPSA